MPTAGQIIRASTTPGFVVGSTTITADSSTFTTSETVVATVTAPLISGITYWVVFIGGWQTTVADTQVNTRIRQDDASGATGKQNVIPATVATGSLFHPFRLEFLYTASSTGSKTFVGTGVRNAGTGTINLDASSVSPAYLTVTVAN